MKYDEWMSESARGILKPRSKELKVVDAALRAYDRSRSDADLTRLSNAIDEWASTKDDWRDSIRGAAVNNLVLYVRKMQGAAIGARSAAFAPRRIVKRVEGEWHVSVDGSQTLTYPSPGYDSYCNTWFQGRHVVDFPLNVNFGIVRTGTAFIVNVRALAEFETGASKHVPAGTVLSIWKTHCESTWNCGVIHVGTRKYDLLFNLIWVRPGAPGPYYTVSIHQPPRQARAAGPVSQADRLAAAKAARDGTPNLKVWGAEDKQAIAHEFGHMLGNPDEYLCTGFTGLAAAYSAAVYNNPAFSTPSIMNNTAESGGRVYERHFGMVVQEIRHFLEYCGPMPIPNVRAAIEKPLNTPSSTEFTLSQAMQKRRRGMGYGDD